MRWIGFCGSRNLPPRTQLPLLHLQSPLQKSKLPHFSQLSIMKMSPLPQLTLFFTVLISNNWLFLLGCDLRKDILVMGLSWNFQLSQVELKSFRAESSRAGHFNFWAETELDFFMYCFSSSKYIFFLLLPIPEPEN